MRHPTKPWAAALTLLVAACGSFDAEKAPADAGPTMEASAFAPPADAGIDAPAPGACPKDAFLCDDFEGDTKAWSVRLEGGGKGAFETGMARSGKKAFRASVMSSADSRETAEIRRSVPATTGRGRFSAQVYIDDLPATDNFVALMAVLFDDGESYSGITVELADQGRLKVYLDGPSERRDASSVRIAPPVETWFELALVFDRGAGNAEVLIDGKPTEPRLVANGFTFGPAAPMLSLRLGLTTNLQVPVTTLSFDDPTLVLLP